MNYETFKAKLKEIDKDIEILKRGSFLYIERDIWFADVYLEETCRVNYKGQFTKHKNKEQLFDVINEFTRTPLNERGIAQKRYKLKAKWLDEVDYLHYDSETKKYKHVDETHATLFTRREKEIFLLERSLEQVYKEIEVTV